MRRPQRCQATFPGFLGFLFTRCGARAGLWFPAWADRRHFIWAIIMSEVQLFRARCLHCLHSLRSLRSCSPACIRLGSTPTSLYLLQSTVFHSLRASSPAALTVSRNLREPTRCIPVGLRGQYHTVVTRLRRRGNILRHLLLASRILLENVACQARDPSPNLSTIDKLLLKVSRDSQQARRACPTSSQAYPHDCYPSQPASKYASAH